jgi:apolipoprotein N-acyltransferase
LRALSRAALVGLGLALLLDEALRSQTLLQLRLFARWSSRPRPRPPACWPPTARTGAASRRASWCSSAVGQRLALPLHELAVLQALAAAAARSGRDALQLRSGGSWRYGVALRQPGALARAVADAGGPAATPVPACDAAREAVRPGPRATRW